jgi:hypothetical protein
MSALRIQYSPIKIHQDSDGVMVVEAVARHSGVLKYRSDSGDRLELVSEELMLARDSDGVPALAWLANAPTSNEHPPQIIRYDEKSREAKQVGEVHKEIHILKDSKGVHKAIVKFDVTDPVTQQEIRDGKKKGVSLGYMCGVRKEDGEWNGQKYTHVQEMPLKIDHLAIVANPRAPEALITRFDSEDAGDVAWSVAEESPVASIEIIHVDACCAACEAPKSTKKVDEPEPGIKKTPKPKKDSDEQMTTATLERSDAPSATTQIMFRSGVVNVPDELLTSLHADGVLELVELNGLEFLVGGDFATDLRNDGLIDHEDANCDKSRGWYPGGKNGKCQRPPKGANTKAGAAKAAAGGASLKKFGKANLNAKNATRLAELRKSKAGAAKAISGNVTGSAMKAGAIAKSSKGVQASKTRAANKSAKANAAAEAAAKRAATDKTAADLQAKRSLSPANQSRLQELKNKNPYAAMSAKVNLSGNSEDVSSGSVLKVLAYKKAEKAAAEAASAKQSASVKKGAATRKSKKTAA